MVPLGDLCDKISDGSHNPPKGIENSKYLMISSKNVFKDHLDLTDVRYLTEEDFEVENKRTNVKANDVLLTIVGTIGRTYLVKGDEGNLVMQRSVAVLTPNSRVTPLFLMFYLHSDKNLEKEGRGNAQKGIYLKQLSQYEIKVPSINLQKQFEAIYRQADKSEFGDIKSQFIEMFKDVTIRVTMEDVVFIKDDCRKPINDSVRSTMKSGELYPYYGATGVVDYINDYITNEELLCIAEDCGNYKAGEESSYIINGKAWVNNHAHVVKPKDICSIKYLHQYLKVFDLMPYVSGTTRLKLTQKKLKEIPVILPSMESQLAFVAVAEQADKSESVCHLSIHDLINSINYN